MADKKQLALDLWWRYQFLRDNGHLKYVKKAKRCENFLAGVQWPREDLDLLAEQQRPALTINKILPTLANIVGDQIRNRTETSFRPRRNGASEETAEALTRVFMQIGDNNQLPWRRTDMYWDGLIGGRGFFDVRLAFSDSLQGDAQIRTLNPKNVLIDGDASEYDPDEWNDVMLTKWLTLDEIEIMYGAKWKKVLGATASQLMPYSYDEQDWERDQFGDPSNDVFWSMDPASQPILKAIRVLERQWKKLDRREHFVHIPTGEIREVPEGLERNDIALFLQQNADYTVIKRTLPRIRWTVAAGNEILHDDWSPYKHFTVVPFFPYFRRGTTIGTVESLLDPQELLNKVSSQELHVVNTTANSGWKLKAGSLQNMNTAELEARGAQTGLVLELDDVADAEKILPNQVPTGLERISWKAEEHIKTISLVPDYASGFAREDVSHKALKTNQALAAGNYVAVQDNLNRTDHLLARALLDLVQTYYTEERLMFITTDPLRRTTEEFKVNEVTPEGEITNDLTLGEYDIVVTSQPERDTMEDNTFEQIVEMRKELDIQIPDSVFIQASRLPDKSMVIEAIEAQTNGPDAQAQRQLDQQREVAEIRGMNAKAGRDEADTQSKQVRTQQDAINLQRPITPDVQLRVEADLAAKKYQTDTDAMVKLEIEKMKLRANPPKQEKTDGKKGKGKGTGKDTRGTSSRKASAR
jgi:hypothetical protein